MKGQVFDSLTYSLRGHQKSAIADVDVFLTSNKMTLDSIRSLLRSMDVKMVSVSRAMTNTSPYARHSVPWAFH